MTVQGRTQGVTGVSEHPSAASNTPSPFSRDLILSNIHFKILQAIAASGFLAALECTKFVFGRGSAPDHSGGTYSAPQIL